MGFFHPECSTIWAHTPMHNKTAALRDLLLHDRHWQLLCFMWHLLMLVRKWALHSMGTIYFLIFLVLLSFFFPEVSKLHLAALRAVTLQSELDFEKPQRSLASPPSATRTAATAVLSTASWEPVTCLRFGMSTVREEEN